MDINKVVGVTKVQSESDFVLDQETFTSGIVVTPENIKFDGRIRNAMYRDVNILRHRTQNTDQYQHLFSERNTLGDCTKHLPLNGIVITNKGKIKDYVVHYGTGENFGVLGHYEIPLYIEIAPYSNVNLHESFWKDSFKRITKIVYVLREGATLNLHRTFKTAKCSSLQIIESDFIQHPTSVLNIETKSLGTVDYLQDLYFVTAYKYTTTNITNRYKVTNQDSVHVITDIKHIGPGSVSNTDVKSITDDNGKFTFSGNIIVDKVAENVDANLQNKNLQLSETSTVITEPKLDIATKEIACKHGCTVSSVDPEQLYLLNTRGFDNIQAKEILTEAFING